MLFRRLITPFAVAACVMSLAACASRGENSQDRGLLGGVFGGGGQVSDAPEAGIGVNSFLWRASLGIFSFMPLFEVDPAASSSPTGTPIPKFRTSASRPRSTFLIPACAPTPCLCSCSSKCAAPMAAGRTLRLILQPASRSKTPF